MIVDWRKSIAIAHLVRARLAEVDGGLWPHHLPEVAASSDELDAFEKDLGTPLPSAYRRFLSYANGWVAFYQAVDLFGLSDLRSGLRHDRASRILASLDPLEPVCGLRNDEVMPIAVSSESTDIFVIGITLSRKPGEVFWLAGQLVERFPNFEEFFLAMVDYNREDVRQFEEEEIDGSA